ncbi:replication-relaxation family protein [Thermodesulfobacteriota bacterium]
MTGRASRWKRQKHPGRMVLQPRDREILKAVYSFRMLSRTQIETLFNFKCARRVNSRLRKLYDHYYLSRSFLPTVRGSAKAIYYLGPQGIAVVCEELGIDMTLIKRKCEATSKLRELFLSHAMELNNVRIAFSLGIENHHEMELERWINDNDCKQEYRTPAPGKTVVRRFRPDGYFRFCYQGKLYSFFLEHDRSTMTLGRFTGKVKSYIDFGVLGYYRQRFGVKYFRVLVITKTRERLYNLKKAVETVTDKLFCFTTIEQVTPNTVFGPIWQRAGKQEYYPLIGR